MPADLAFELGYLLSDLLGSEVVVEGYEFDPSEARLCVRVRSGSRAGEACATVRSCRGLEGVKAVRCLSRTLAQGGKPLEELARAVKEALGV